MTIDAPLESFWSRRLRAVRAEAEAEAALAARQERDAAEAARNARDATRNDAEILEELGLPDPDLLTAGDDFSAFMNAAVPERLRRRALRVLWRSNPVLANLDGLVDHGEDFGDGAMVMPGMKTAYQAGRGMLDHVNALARAQELETRAEKAGADPAGRTLAEGDAPEGDDVLGGTASRRMNVEADLSYRSAADDRRAADREPFATNSDGPDKVMPSMVRDAEETPVHDQPRPRHMRFTFAD